MKERKLTYTLDQWKEKINGKKKHKYNATACESDGVKFPSKLERSYYERLIAAVSRQEVDFFLRQVPFHLPGNVKYLVDFVVFYWGNAPHHNSVEYVDVKGKMTPMSILKIKQVEALYPVKIKIVDDHYLKNNIT